MAMEAAQRAEIGQRIKELRGHQPQPELARKLNVSLRAVQKWEAGESAPQWENLVALSRYFHVTQDFLLYGDRSETDVASGQLDRIEQKVDKLLEAAAEILSRLPAEGFGEVFEKAARRRDEQRTQPAADQRRKPRSRKAS